MKKKIQKKLTLKKLTIANFDDDSMRKIGGGAVSLGTICVTCKVGCSDVYQCNSIATCSPTNCETCPGAGTQCGTDCLSCPC